MNDKERFSQTNFTLWMMSLLLIFAPFLRAAQAQDLPPEVLRYADMVLYNGHVLTMDQDQPPFNVTQAVALQDGLILAVGEDDRILRHLRHQRATLPRAGSRGCLFLASHRS